jgi:hypothetical protein
MAVITVEVGEEALELLSSLAKLLGVTVDEAASSIVNKYARKELVRQVTDHELTKNAELYRRLARVPEGT